MISKPKCLYNNIFKYLMITMVIIDIHILNNMIKI